VTSILRSFYMASPNSLGWSLQYGLDNLPVGFKCTSITAQISDLQITRAYGAKNASTINNGVVEFDAAGSRLGVRLLGPDGVMYASHEVRPPPFVISLQPGDDDGRRRARGALQGVAIDDQAPAVSRKRPGDYSARFSMTVAGADLDALLARQVDTDETCHVFS
jgi:hypothetical protein